MEYRQQWYGIVRSVNMKLTFDRRYDKWAQIREARERCESCMYDALDGEICCKHHCGEYTICADCKAKCREGNKLCEK